MTPRPTSGSSSLKPGWKASSRSRSHRSFQDQISAGADAIVTPGTEQNAAVLEDWGGTYATMNLLSPTLETVDVGERSTESGRSLGQYIVERLGGPEATGKVLIGICVAGLSVLENRAEGLIEGLSAAPGLDHRAVRDGHRSEPELPDL